MKIRVRCNVVSCKQLVARELHFLRSLGTCHWHKRPGKPQRLPSGSSQVHPHSSVQLPSPSRPCLEPHIVNPFSTHLQLMEVVRNRVFYHSKSTRGSLRFSIANVTTTLEDLPLGIQTSIILQTYTRINVVSRNISVSLNTPQYSVFLRFHCGTFWTGSRVAGCYDTDFYAT